MNNNIKNLVAARKAALGGNEQQAYQLLSQTKVPQHMWDGLIWRWKPPLRITRSMIAAAWHADRS